jgi:hypothetical protein
MAAPVPEIVDTPLYLYNVLPILWPLQGGIADRKKSDCKSSVYQVGHNGPKPIIHANTLSL